MSGVQVAKKPGADLPQTDTGLDHSVQVIKDEQREILYMIKDAETTYIINIIRKACILATIGETAEHQTCGRLTSGRKIRSMES